MTKRLKVVALTCFFSVFLIACPRVAKVDIFNNTGVDISVDVGGKTTHIISGDNKSIEFSSRNLIVESSLGKWVYGRSLIPYRGENGPYFDGIIYVQLNQDGKVIAVKKQTKRPIAKFANQPRGFPLEPGS